MDTDKTSLPTVGHGLDVAVGEASTAGSLELRPGLDGHRQDKSAYRRARTRRGGRGGVGGREP
jgi:hypothetical protein